jgi:hypothetical protein
MPTFSGGAFSFSTQGSGGTGWVQGMTFGNGGCASFAGPAQPQQQRQSANNALDNTDRLPFARVRILEAMARAAPALKAEECVLTLRAALDDFTTEWPAEWTQKEDHIKLLTGVVRVAVAMARDPTTAQSPTIWQSMVFPAPANDTKVTHCIRVILKRLMECCYCRVAGSSAATATSTGLLEGQKH